MIEKINGVQRLGIVLIIIGIIFLLFPVVIGTTALLIISSIVIGIGIYLLVSTYKTESVFLRLASIFIILTGLVIFFNPGIILFFIGMSCIVSGIGNLFYIYSASNRTNRNIIYSVALIILGGYAAFNTKAAMATIFILLGILSIVIGSLLVTNKSISIFFNKTSNNTYDDDIIDVEFHEKKDE